MNKAIQSITNKLIFLLVLLGLFQTYEITRWATLRYERATAIAGKAQRAAEVIENPLSLLGMGEDE